MVLDDLRKREEKKFSELEGNLKAHEGRLVLVDKTIVHETRSKGCWGSPDIKFYERRTGLIKNPYLIIDKSDPFYPIHYGLEIVVNQQLDLHENYIAPVDKIVSLEEGNIKISHKDFEGKHNYPVSPCTPEPFRSYIGGIDILIGNEKVWDFIFAHYHKKATELYNYIGGLLKNTEKIMEIKDFNLKRQKEMIVENLERLLAEESKLKQKIKLIYSSRRRGGFVHDGAIVMVEDEDDAKIVSWGERDKLDNIRRTIRATLDEALKLNMHMDPTIYLVESAPGKKTEIKISEYITNLNSVYMEKHQNIFK